MKGIRHGSGVYFRTPVLTEWQLMAIAESVAFAITIAETLQAAFPDREFAYGRSDSGIESVKPATAMATESDGNSEELLRLRTELCRLKMTPPAPSGVYAVAFDVNECALLIDMLDARIRAAEDDGAPPNHRSVVFRDKLNRKLIVLKEAALSTCPPKTPLTDEEFARIRETVAGWRRSIDSPDTEAPIDIHSADVAVVEHILGSFPSTAVLSDEERKALALAIRLVGDCAAGDSLRNLLARLGGGNE
jgi:hypothetical protein